MPSDRIAGRFVRSAPARGPPLTTPPDPNGPVDPAPAPRWVEHFFRHEYGRLVAMLVRRVGLVHLEAIEDAVQSAMLAAVDAWLAKGTPDNPSAWLYRVAHNRLLGALRKEGGQRRLLRRDGADDVEAEATAPSFEGEVRDELLRMLFICCDERLPHDSRLVLALKTLCGFSVDEIAQRLFTTEASVYKRLTRARETLREASLRTETPALECARARLPDVHSILYLLFNEGYLSIHAEHAIRAELCDEALRLTTLLATHPVGAEPASFALLALMHLHRARLASRQDVSLGLLLLEEQDRSLWDAEHIEQGVAWLERSAHGERFTRFHAEAGIAAEHCFAPSFAATRWLEIAGLYALLERLDPSPMHTLNRAVAVAEGESPAAALALLAETAPPAWLEGHYSWAAVLADLHRRAGNAEAAASYRDQALAAAPSPALQRVLRRRLREGT